MKSTLLRHRSVVISILLGCILIWSVLSRVSLEEVFKTFERVSSPLIAGYVLVSILIAIGLTIKWDLILRSYKVRLPFYSLFSYRLIGYAVSYITPASHIGGEPIRAYLLQKQGVPFKLGLSSAVVDRSIDLIFNIGAFFIGALIVLNAGIFPIAARATIFLLSLLLVVVATLFIYNILQQKKVFVPLLRWFRCNKLKRWRKIKREAEEIEGLIEQFFQHKREFRRAMLINAFLWVLMFLEYKLALLILGYNANLFGIFLFLTGVGIAYSIPIPAALGVLELGQVSAGALLGVQSSIGVALAFLVRLRDSIWTILGLILLAILHLNLFKLLEKSRRMAKESMR